MKSIKRIIFAALSLLFAAVGCNKISPGAESAPEEESADAVIAGRMIVQLSEEAAQRLENGGGCVLRSGCNFGGKTLSL